MSLGKETTADRPGTITTRKEVNGNDRMDHRNVSVERHFGAHVYRAVGWSRVEKPARKKRRLDSGQSGQTRARMGHARQPGSRQEVEFVFSDQTKVSSIIPVSAFAFD